MHLWNVHDRDDFVDLLVGILLMEFFFGDLLCLLLCFFFSIILHVIFGIVDYVLDKVPEAACEFHALESNHEVFHSVDSNIDNLRFDIVAMLVPNFVDLIFDLMCCSVNLV